MLLCHSIISFFCSTMVSVKILWKGFKMQEQHLLHKLTPRIGRQRQGSVQQHLEIHWNKQTIMVHWATSPCRTHWIPQNSPYQKLQQHPLPITTQTLPGRENNQIDGPRAVHWYHVPAWYIYFRSYSLLQLSQTLMPVQMAQWVSTSPLVYCSFRKLLLYQQEALN